jgi:SAM-dependent methyltransferase
MRLLAVRDHQQQEFDLAVALGTEHLARLWNEMASEFTVLKARLRELESREPEAADLFRSTGVQLGRLFESAQVHELRLHEVQDGLSRLEVESSRLTKMVYEEMRAIPYMDPADAYLLELSDGTKTLGFQRESLKDNSYVHFESIFRGPEAEIARRQAPYLNQINTQMAVLDIGCGRGEFLGLLKANNINATGVEKDPAVAEVSLTRGLEVVLDDAVHFLQNAPNASASTIFAAQLVEHLELQDLQEFMRQSRRVLCLGGVLILETVNPYRGASFRTFWTDLSHVRPIFPEVLLSLAEEAGFSEATVMFPLGSGDLETDRWSQGEYAIVAHQGRMPS